MFEPFGYLVGRLIELALGCTLDCTISFSLACSRLHTSIFLAVTTIAMLRRLRVEDALNTHNTPIGDYYEYKSDRGDFLRVTKENSVIVLGSYKDRRKQELEQVRDYLKTEGYDAALLEELPDHPL